MLARGRESRPGLSVSVGRLALRHKENEWRTNAPENVIEEDEE